MTAISDFFTRFDNMKPRRPEGSRIEATGSEGREMWAIYVRIAERAGLDLDELHQEQIDRFDAMPWVVARRMAVEGNPLVTLHQALSEMAVEMFLAGVLWEQERHLPPLEGLDL